MEEVHSPRILLSDDLKSYKESLLPELSHEQFQKCVDIVLKEEFPHHNRKSLNCCCVLKVMWLCWLFFLAFCLVAAGFKPVAFFMHKVLNRCCGNFGTVVTPES